MDRKYNCYILTNEIDNKTYIGMTNDIQNRIRRHNQVIKGGAKYTTAHGNKTWKYAVIISNIPDKVTAMQLEWKLKHPYRRGIEKRIQHLYQVLDTDEWKEKSKDYNIQIF